MARLYDVCVGCRQMHEIEKAGRCSRCLAYFEVNACNPPRGSCGGDIPVLAPVAITRRRLEFPSCASCASPHVIDLAPGATWREGKCENCGLWTEVAGREAFLVTLDRVRRRLLQSS